MSELFACTTCGFMTPDWEKLSDHLALAHTDRSIEYLVDLALREAIQVAELEKLYSRCT